MVIMIASFSFICHIIDYLMMNTFHYQQYLTHANLGSSPKMYSRLAQNSVLTNHVL